MIGFLEHLETKFQFKYLLVGGILTPLYAEVRQTQDIDLVIEIFPQEKNKDVLLSEFKRFRYIPATNWTDTFKHGPGNHFIQIFDEETAVKIDLNLSWPEEETYSIYGQLRRCSLTHRRRVNFLTTECWVQSKEDFILAKLVYKGYQDYKDALACWLRFRDELNQSYIDKKSAEYKVQDIWNAIQKEVPVDEVYPEDP